MENDRKLIQFHFITNAEVSTHYHQNPEVFYVLTGELKVQIDETTFLMKQGDIILINANKRHTMNGNEELLGARFEIDFHLLAEYMESMQLLFWCNSVADKNAAYADLREVFDHILSRYFEKDEKSALPVVMTRDPKEVNKLNAAQMMGMTIGQIVLNLFVLKLVLWFGKGDQAAGYHSTAIVLALIALPMFWAVAYLSKERITVKKEDQGKVSEGLKLVFKNKNLVCAMMYCFFNMFGMLGRISVAVYFYMHCVQNFTFITVFMMMQMIVGTLIMPFTPKIIDKFGKKKTAIISMVIQGTALIILFFGPYENIVFDFVVLIYYGLGYVAGPCGAGMMIDAIDDFDDKYGYRNDGMAFSFQGTTVKIATAIANSLFLVVMGAFGYVGGGEITPHVQTGINVAANLLPGLVFFMGIIPLAIYNLDKPGYMEAVRERLTARDKAKREAAKEA